MDGVTAGATGAQGSRHGQRGGRLDLPFADGLRALAALAVVVNHAYTASGRSGSAERDLPGWMERINLGQFAVPVFIVLSGFVLMLPVARTPGLALRGGALTFLKRRARRLLPPYYASLALSLLVIAAVPLLRTEHGTAWDSRIPVTWSGLLSHALVVHDLWPAWRLQINGPAWSVGTEWQIYLLMPLLLLPVWRRAGAVGTVATALAVGWGLHFAWPVIDEAHPWMVADFTLGMVAATAVARRRCPSWLGAATAVVAAATAVAFVVAEDTVRRETWLSEVELGVVVAMLLTWMGHRSLEGRRTAVHSVLEWRPLVALGLWSYSLYLVHSPVISLGNLLTLDAPLSTAARFGLQLLVWVPLALACSYGFHLLVERRFLNGHQQRSAAPADARAATAAASGSEAQERQAA